MKKRKQIKKRGKLLSRPFKITFKKPLKHINRKPLNIRFAPVISSKRLTKRRNNTLQKKTSANTIQKRTNLLHTITNSFTGKKRCIESKKQADMARRRNFFRQKGKGNTSVRPEHNRKYKRC